MTNAKMRPVSSRTLRLSIALSWVLAAFAMLVPASDASAQSRSYEEGPAVRRVLLFRSGRLEVNPTLGSTISEVWQNSVVLGVGGRYHLTNAFSFGANLAYGGLAFDSTIASSFADTSGVRAARTDYSVPMLMTDFHLGFAPIQGKFNLVGDHIHHYDFNVSLGVGGALLDSDSPDLSGFKFGPAIGAGFRVFIQDGMALTFAVQDYIYPSAKAQLANQTVTEEWENHFVTSLGVSFFFPERVRVSR